MGDFPRAKEQGDAELIIYLLQVIHIFINFISLQILVKIYPSLSLAL